MELFCLNFDYPFLMHGITLGNTSLIANSFKNSSSFIAFFFHSLSEVVRESKNLSIKSSYIRLEVRMHLIKALSMIDLWPIIIWGYIYVFSSKQSYLNNPLWVKVQSCVTLYKGSDQSWFTFLNWIAKMSYMLTILKL